jgi:hypothetical protein
MSVIMVLDRKSFNACGALLSILLAAHAIFIAGCTDSMSKRESTYQRVVRTDDLSADVCLDYARIRSSILSGKAGLRAAIAELEDPAVQDYGQLCTACEIVAAFYALLSQYPDEFSSELASITRAFQALLSEPGENRAKCAVTYAFYHPSLCSDRDLHLIAALIGDSRPYVARFSRLVCFTRAKVDLLPEQDLALSAAVANDDLMLLIAQYWKAFAALHESGPDGEEQVSDLATRRWRLIQEYRTRLAQVLPHS